VVSRALQGLHELKYGECACIVMSAAVGHNVCIAVNVLAVESSLSLYILVYSMFLTQRRHLGDTLSTGSGPFRGSGGYLLSFSAEAYFQLHASL
jgi:hypothetical protein